MASTGRIAAIELLGKARLFDPQNFYGQNALKASLLRNTEALVDWHFLSELSEDGHLSRIGRYHRVRGPDSVHQIERILNSLGQEQPVPVFSSFPVQSADLTVAILGSEVVSSRIALNLIFHCTAQELLPHLFGGGQTARTASDAIAVAARMARNLVFVSDAVRQSFESPIVVEFLGLGQHHPAHTEVIPNTIDSSWLAGAPSHGVVRRDDSAFIVGMLAGFKPYKGRDVVAALLRHAQASEMARTWSFALSALPNYGTRDLLAVLDSQCHDLVSAGRVLLFIDVSQWVDVAPGITAVARRDYTAFRESLPPRLKRCADRCFVGVSEQPVAAQFSVQIRPSLHEGFGRAVVESFLLGRPVVGSDRDGLRTLLPKELTIPFPPEASLAAAVSSPHAAPYRQMCDELGLMFMERLSLLERHPYEDVGGLRRKAEAYLDTGRLVSRYINLMMPTGTAGDLAAPLPPGAR